MYIARAEASAPASRIHTVPGRVVGGVEAESQRTEVWWGQLATTGGRWLRLREEPFLVELPAWCGPFKATGSGEEGGSASAARRFSRRCAVCSSTVWDNVGKADPEAAIQQRLRLALVLNER